MNNERCENCKYAKTYVDGYGNPIAEISCRRYPQTILKLKDKWCGEYSPKAANGKEGEE